MRIRRNTAKVVFLSVFAIILCICPLYISAQGSVITYTEKNNDNGRPPRVLATRKFDDGTVVVRIVKDVPGTPTCIYDMLSLRFIQPDGIVAKDFNLEDLQIQQNNYCKPEGAIDYQLIRKNQILVTYYVSTDVRTFEQFGIIIDNDGKVINRVSFGLTAGPISKIQLNTDRTKGFLRLASTIQDGATYTTWVQYKIEEDGSFTKLTEGPFNFDYFSSSTATVMSTVGEGYAVAYAVMKNTYVATNPLLSQGTLYALTIGYNQTTVSPLLLYQTPLPNLSFRALSCDISFAGVGQVCTLTVATLGADGLPTNNFYIKINFLSSGSVTSSKVISRIIPNDVPTSIWRVDSLPHGGYLFTNVTNTVPDNSIWGYLFGEEDPTAVNWGLRYPEPINVDGVFEILPDNTLLVFQVGADFSWQYESITLPRFDGKTDTGYSNVNILSTIPGMSGSINENSTTSVQINFVNPVELSDGNLLIYQVGDNLSLRQMIPGTKCTLVPDSNDTSVVANILISTFSVPKGNYFIMMENNFVKDKAYKEPLLGIRENVWWFSTDDEKVKLTPSRSGLFRLNVDGTKYYNSLTTREDRRNFFNKLRDELALSVPVDTSRFVIIEKSQLDRTVNEEQYLISIGVKDNKKESDISVASIMDYIDTMVRNKDQTQIHLGTTTNYLDETYGFNRIPNIWEKYKNVLIVLFVLVLFVLGSFLSAFIKTKREDNKKEIRNVAILQLGLIIFDLVVDVLFVSNSSKDFPELYIPSVVFVTLPIAINTTLAFYIITQENSLNQKFYQWFIKNGKIASVFTVLAGADIEALNILHSNLLGIELFGAPFSTRARRIITQGGYANIFTEDIPQVIIQVIYYRKAVSYGLIPLLTMISSVLTLTINIVTTGYEFVFQKQSEPSETSETSGTSGTGTNRTLVENKQQSPSDQ